MAAVAIRDDTLVVTMTGIRKLWTLKNELSIPLDNVAGVTADPGIRADFPRLGQKRVGTDLYGVYFGGTFVQDGDRVFWDVRRPEKAIVISLKNEDFSRLVIEVERPDASVQTIEHALAARKKQRSDDVPGKADRG